MANTCEKINENQIKGFKKSENIHNRNTKVYFKREDEPLSVCSFHKRALIEFFPIKDTCWKIVF